MIFSVCDLIRTWTQVFVIIFTLLSLIVCRCRAARRCGPCQSLPCNSPCNDDAARDVCRDICCDPDPCESPSALEMAPRHSIPSRRTTRSASPQRLRAECTNPLDFECGYLRQKSNLDCECFDSEPRPPFVVRRVWLCVLKLISYTLGDFIFSFEF